MRTRGVSVGGGSGSTEREARRKKGGCGVAEALVAAAAEERMLTIDVEVSTIWLAVRMISLSDEARRRFFAAPVIETAVASPAKRVVAYALDRLEGAVAIRAAR